jgi:hypothetical protein
MARGGEKGGGKEGGGRIKMKTGVESCHTSSFIWRRRYPYTAHARSKI